MPKYSLYIYSKAKKEYNKLDKTTKQKIKQKLYDLEKNPYLGIHLKKVKFWKLRVEDYRIIYEIKDKEIIVLIINHRKNVYDKFYRLFK